LNSPSPTLGNQQTSAIFSVTTTISPVYSYGLFLNRFCMQQTQGGTIFAVGANDCGSSGQQISYSVYSDAGNTLGAITIIIFVYLNSAIYPANVYVYPLTNLPYSSNLINANTLLPAGAFSTGYNDKCFIGYSSLA
jgi:hypothetical protein